MSKLDLGCQRLERASTPLPRLGCEREDPDGPKRECILPKRNALSTPSDLACPTRRRNWTLYTDVLGPLVAVLNVLGIGAHGRYAPAALRAEATSRTMSADDTGTATMLMPIDQLDKGALAPLGWFLSPTAREALKAQADCLRRELDGKLVDELLGHCR